VTADHHAELRTVKPGGPYVCVCVKFHVPKPVVLHAHHVWPLGEGGPDTQGNQLFVCPTTHYSIHALWPLMDRHDGKVPGAELKRFPRYVRAVVQRGWDAKQAAQTPHAA
jgi:hypothetical protein